MAVHELRKSALLFHPTDRSVICELMAQTNPVAWFHLRNQDIGRDRNADRLFGRVDKFFITIAMTFVQSGSDTLQNLVTQIDERRVVRQIISRKLLQRFS